MICSLMSMRVQVDHGFLRAGHWGLIGSMQDVGLIERQGPTWEAYVSEQCETLSVRLAKSDSTRSCIPTMLEWISSKGMRPTILCETASIRKAMGVAGDGCNLVCAGSLWEVDDEQYYACWHDGEVHLYPISHPFGPDYVCPITMGDISSLPPGMKVGAAS